MPNSGNTSYHADHNSHCVFNYDHHQQHQQQHLLAISQYNFNPIEPSTASLYYHCAQSINQWANLPTSRSEKTHIPVNDDSSSSSSRVVENGRDFQTRKIYSNRHFDKLGGEKAKTKRRAIRKYTKSANEITTSSSNKNSTALDIFLRWRAINEQ